MAKEGVARRLADILASDVGGYNCPMDADENATPGTLNAFRGVFDDLMAKHRDGEFASADDRMIAEFTSLVEAVRCEVEFQQDLETRNADLVE